MKTYRQEFRSAKRNNETFAQFVTNLRRKLQFWLTAAEVPKTCDGLLDFIIYDQFMASIPLDLRTHLKEQGHKRLATAIEAADNWLSAHPEKPKLKFTLNTNPPGNSTANVSSSQIKSPKLNPPLNKNINCYNCGVNGHLKSNCPTIFKQKSNFQSSKTNNVNTVGISYDKNISRKFMCQGTVNGSNVSTIVRDTGCSCVVVAEDVLRDVKFD